MHWIITCDCGQELIGATHDELVAATRRHVAEDHPAMAVFPSRRDILAMAAEGPTMTTMEAL